VGVLTRDKILEELAKGVEGDGVVITPMKQSQVGASSVDVHLAHEFVVFRRASITSLDIGEDRVYPNVHSYQEKVRIRSEERFVLHPHQLALGATREYVSLPRSISANIVGRSTWGRTGLIIATATKIDPGFRGCVTLEIVNAGVIPIVLYPGILVAQLVFFRTEGVAEYSGSYECPTGPEFPKLEKEAEHIERHLR
jgi:dCTP deaminase